MGCPFRIYEWVGARDRIGRRDPWHRPLNRNYDYIYTCGVDEPLRRYLERHSRASEVAGEGRIYRISAN